MIYECRVEVISLNDFSNYQIPVEFFKDLRDGNTNSKEVLKYEVKFKSFLGKIKKGNLKSKF